MRVTELVERRKDKEFMERLDRRLEEDLPVLEALAGPDDPVRLWRRALVWVRSRLKRKRPWALHASLRSARSPRRVPG